MKILKQKDGHPRGVAPGKSLDTVAFEILPYPILGQSTYLQQNYLDMTSNFTPLDPVPRLIGMDPLLLRQQFCFSYFYRRFLRVTHPVDQCMTVRMWMCMIQQWNL